MRKTLLLLASLAVVFATFQSGCYRQTFSYQSRGAAATTEVGNGFLINGLVATGRPIKAFELCPQGVAKVEVVHTFGDQFIGCLTLSIYTPNTVQVTCASGGAHNFYLDQNDNVVAHQVVSPKGKIVEQTMTTDVL